MNAYSLTIGRYMTLATYHDAGIAFRRARYFADRHGAAVEVSVQIAGVFVTGHVFPDPGLYDLDTLQNWPEDRA